MSIWSYITDIELQRLREAKRAIEAERSELEKLDRAHRDTTQKMYAAEGALQKHQALIVARAVGESSAPLPPAPETAQELKLVLNAVEQHRKMKRQDVEMAVARFQQLKAVTLEACVARAADRYREQASALAETWNEISTANIVRGYANGGWRQIYIPALEGVQGATESYGRPTLFDGSEPDVAAMEKELILKI